MSDSKEKYGSKDHPDVDVNYIKELVKLIKKLVLQQFIEP